MTTANPPGQPPRVPTSPPVSNGAAQRDATESTASPLRGVAEVVAFIPYQLGFTPENSVVAVFLEGSRLLGVARFDLFRAPADAADIAAFVQRSRARTMTDAIVVGYGLSTDVTSCAELAARTIERTGRVVSHVVVVDADQWCALECGCTGCPSTLRPMADIRTTPVAVEAILRGAQPGISRADIEALTAPTVDELARARRVDPALRQPAQQVSPPAWSALARVLAGTGPLDTVPDADLVAATRSLRSVTVRDTVLAWVAPGAFRPSLLSGGVTALTGACRRQHLRAVPTAAVARLIRWANSVPGPDRAPPWSIVAAHEWARGGGALATLAISAALDAQPDYPLAVLIGRCLESGVTPTDSAP